MTSKKEREAELAETVISDVEALRHERRNADLEGSLSIKDWVDRVASATKQSAKLARQENPDLEYESWLEVAEIVVGRLEQIRTLAERRVCDHDWPADLEPHSSCLNGCGGLYGEWVN